MARMPSMVALLGLLAVAGYQNRDKLGELLNGLKDDPSNPPDITTQSSGLSDILRGLGGAFGSDRGGSVVSGGLNELLDRFRQTGRGEKAESWVSTGENAELEATDLEEALGEETLNELSHKTGLTRAELLQRLSKSLPEAVNELTPDGRLPTQQEASRFI